MDIRLPLSSAQLGQRDAETGRIVSWPVLDVVGAPITNVVGPTLKLVDEWSFVLIPVALEGVEINFVEPVEEPLEYEDYEVIDERPSVPMLDEQFAQAVIDAVAEINAEQAAEPEPVEPVSEEPAEPAPAAKPSKRKR